MIAEILTIPMSAIDSELHASRPSFRLSLGLAALLCVLIHVLAAQASATSPSEGPPPQTALLIASSAVVLWRARFRTLRRA